MLQNVRRISVAGFLAFTILTPNSARALDNAVFTKSFVDYEEAVDRFVKLLVTADWAKAEPVASEIEVKSKMLKELGEKDTNQLWLFDVTNLWHHSKELIDAVKSKEATECVYLVGTLTSHIGYIQAANPLWLRGYLSDQMKALEDGIQTKNQQKARDAAEILHVSAAKIILSAGLQNDLYVHIRWLPDVREVSRDGDSIIEQVNGNDWEGPKAGLAKIKAAMAKWDKAFKV
ncbi:MAG: hypothetical protein HQL41_11255 [Alphaproteobacteria bacterium]|nr:hypothetical protein [Alphaproteobacteria bacterium]